jgi:tetratricopeptide (TPR) repeat protein
MMSAEDFESQLIGVEESSFSRPDDADGARPMHLRLARVHLRTGAFGLARAELETAAGLGDLDDEALLDLAEIRWRTADLGGAGDAAEAYLAAGGGDALGFLIAAEAMAALGRPGEARRLARTALERADRPLDSLFAGIARSGVWPHDPLTPGDPVATLFPFAPGLGVAPSAPFGATSPRPAPVPTSPEPASPASVTDQEPGFWDEQPEADRPVAAPAPEPGSELGLARALIGAGQADAAVVHLAVALRLDPALAPEVLALAEGRHGPIFELLRGDAHRLSGDEPSARRAYAAAAADPAAGPDSAKSALPDAAIDQPPTKEEP